MGVFEPDLLRGRVALVTGGGSGIGAGIARALARHGASVALCGRTESKLRAVAAEIEQAGGMGLPHVADVRDPGALDALYEAIEDRWGRLDILVNSAAGNFLCPAVQLSANGFGTVVDIDLKGTFNATRAAFTLLSRAEGCVVNISATLQYRGTPLQVHAASAKAGVDAMTRTLALEWGTVGIRVNGVAPGPIEDTEGLTRLAPPEVREGLARQIPLGRLGRVDEVADAVLFLVSPASRYITGSILVVDGGQWLGSGSRLG